MKNRLTTKVFLITLVVLALFVLSAVFLVSTKSESIPIENTVVLRTAETPMQADSADAIESGAPSSEKTPITNSGLVADESDIPQAENVEKATIDYSSETVEDAAEQAFIGGDEEEALEERVETASVSVPEPSLNADDQAEKHTEAKATAEMPVMNNAQEEGSDPAPFPTQGAEFQNQIESSEANDVESRIANIDAKPITAELTTNLNDLFLVLCLMLTVVLVGSVVTNIMLFKWRRQAGDNQVSMIPSQAMVLFQKQSRELQAFAKEIARYISEVANHTGENKKSFNDLMESFSVLQTTLDQKEKEIARWKSGYDVQVYKKFLSRFVKLERVLSEDIEDFAEKDPAIAKSLSQIRELLIDALTECGLTEFTPKVGESIRTAFGIDENYKTSPTTDHAKALTIAEVLSPGFMLSTPSGPESVSNARVRVFIPAEEVSNG